MSYFDLVSQSRFQTSLKYKMLLKPVSKFDVKYLCWFLFLFSVTKNGVHVFVLTRFRSSRFKTFLLLFDFAFLISNDSLIFRLWYCCSFNKVSVFIQLNCPWYSRQYSVPPELSHFLLKLSCWCSMVLVMTFPLVSLIHRSLQLKSNC